MTRWRPDPTFYPSPKEAIEAPDERLAYVALLNPKGSGESDGIGVVDLNPDSKSYGNVLHKTEFPNADNELHHFGWNACSSHLCPYAPNAHVERRYLVVPGTNSSRIHILDTKPDPRQPELIVKVIEGTKCIAQDRLRRSAHGALRPRRHLHERARRTRRQRSGRHLHARPRDLRGEGPVGARPRAAAAGLRLLVAPGPGHHDHQRVGHAEHGEGRREPRAAARRASTATRCTCGTCASGRHMQELDLGAEQQMVLELRPAHNPTRAYGFVGVVMSLEDLSSLDLALVPATRSNGTAGRVEGEEGDRRFRPSPPTPDDLPPLLKGFKARAAAGDRHQPVGRRPVPLRVVLGHRASSCSTT